MVTRTRELERLEHLLRHFPVVAILGARQVGKTTLARQLAATQPAGTTFFDLESPADLARLADPLLALGGLRGLVVLDEVQRLPEVFPVLRVLADRADAPARFLVLGSASPELLRQSSESLAGRIAYHELTGLGLDEVGADQLERLWIRGGYPRSFTAAKAPDSWEWRQQYATTLLERDMPQLGFRMPAPALRRFWTMLAHYHGQVWSAAEFARSFGVSDPTVRRYLDALAAALVVRQLLPWHENIAKRQVKAPKVYLADSGMLHMLLGMRTRQELDGHPKLGASWEGFAIEQVVRRLSVRREECWFWATHAGAELDLLVARGATRLGFEVKRTTAPAVTRSMRSALEDLSLARLDVVHAGPDTYPLAERVRALSCHRLLQDLEPLP